MARSLFENLEKPSSEWLFESANPANPDSPSSIKGISKNLRRPSEALFNSKGLIKLGPSASKALEGKGTGFLLSQE